MARFYPLYVRRSDGKLDTSDKGKRGETNTPTQAQMDQRPNSQGVCDFYREVTSSDAKHLDWRRKLGGMLARELGVKTQSSGTYFPIRSVSDQQQRRFTDPSSEEDGYILAVFPESYRLYEHVKKKTSKDGKTEVKTKTHAGGGNDRQDAYLYGHRMGRKKRYRSPLEFFPHLLWLSTDESGDPDNCSCRICTPEDLETVIPQAKLNPEKPAVVRQPEKHTVVHPSVIIPSRRPSQDSGKNKQEPQAPAEYQSPKPAPLPQPQSADQALDQQYNTFMYRPGELVWFRRGQAWGLAVVARRWVTQTHRYLYHVQPLSHPFSHPSVTMSENSDMRPWLAWSVPTFTCDGLNGLTDATSYDTADWHGIMQKRYGAGDAEVDGSILAAKAIDGTYTPFNSIKSVEPQAGGTVRKEYFGGIYLGAEKIWLGDPVRLHTGSGSDILVTQAIICRTSNVNFSNQTTVYFVGDTYSLASFALNNPRAPNPAILESNPHLPRRLIEDLDYRNRRTIPIKQTAFYWNLISTNSKLEINEVKGRWYEASLLLPILDSARFEKAAQRGEISEASLSMNSRGDCLNANKPPGTPKAPRINVRKATRQDAFGRAVPTGMQVLDSVQPPDATIDPNLVTSSEQSMDIDPRFDIAQSGAHSPPAESMDPGGGLDEFMNLDNVDELPGSGHGYGSQSGEHRYY